MTQKRMRVFAGPNGSGKTTIIKDLPEDLPLGVYVNADDIERTLRETNALPFISFGLEIKNTVLIDFFRSSTFAPYKRQQNDLFTKLSVENNILHIDTWVDSYLAADLSEFIRQNLLKNEMSFSYETVLSHQGKVEFIKKARSENYRVYLYYVATEDPEINISRIKLRVNQNGHNVDSQTVRDRYYRSLQLLKEVVKQTNRAYIFDNSGSVGEIIAEITNGIDVEIVDPENVPNWFIKYLVD